MNDSAVSHLLSLTGQESLFDTPQAKGMGILDSTSPLRLDPLRYLF